MVDHAFARPIAVVVLPAPPHAPTTNVIGGTGSRTWAAAVDVLVAELFGWGSDERKHLGYRCFHDLRFLTEPAEPILRVVVVGHDAFPIEVMSVRPPTSVTLTI